jgi:hypothetical protein
VYPAVPQEELPAPEDVVIGAGLYRFVERDYYTKRDVVGVMAVAGVYKVAQVFERI